MSNKYDFTIDLNDNSSHSYILKTIKPNSTILEFGAANGKMTKYMKEELNCSISIIEMSVMDGLEAAKYADQALIGNEEGNIENYKWNEDFSNKFDYILFADILEHLYTPSLVLNKSVDKLKDDGSIIISIPNIAHNAVIIDLINGKFNYRDLGLLDRTHIRFFTRSSLIQMIEDAGLTIINEMNTILPVGHTEFENNWTDVEKYTKMELEYRNDGEIYQFVWELKKK